MRTKRLILASVITVVALSVGVLPSAADHLGPHVVPLARGTFTDDVAAMIKVKEGGRQTDVLKTKDASDVVVVQITIPDGAQIPWHSHSGPVFGVNAGHGTLTSVHGDDCVLREFPPGTALVDRGQRTVHAAFNDSGQDVVVYATFLGVQDAPLIPADPPEGCDPFP